MIGNRQTMRSKMLALSALALSTGVFCSSLAQESTQDSTPVRPIPASAVAQETEQVDSDLRRLRSLVNSSNRVTSARAELERLETTIDALEQDHAGVTPGSLSRSQLNTALGGWRRVADKLVEMDELIATEAQRLEDGIARLARTHSVWIRSKEIASNQETPQAVLGRMESVAAEVGELRHTLEGQLAPLLVMGDRVASDRIRVAAALDQIDDAARQKRQRILRRTSPPLWRAFAATTDGLPGLGEHLGTSWRQHLSGLTEFADDSRDLLYLHILLTAALMILLTRLGRQARVWGEDDADLKPASRILSRPVAAAIVVSLSGTVVLYPQAPLVVWEIAYVVAALPLVMLVRATLPARVRGALYGLVGLFILLHLLNLAQGHALFERLSHLVLTVVALAGLLHLLWRSKAKALPIGAGAWWRATLLACRVTALMLVVSIVANVFGVIGLSRLLTRGTLNAAYLGVAFLASALILEGALTVGLRARSAQALRMVRDYPKLLRRRLSGLIRVIALLLWASVVLLVFDLKDPFGAWVRALWVRPWTIGSLELSLGSVVTFVLAIWVSIQVSRFVRFALAEEVFPRVTLPRGLPGTISMLVRYGILTIGFLIAIAAAGIELSDFAILAGALGVGIGFGLQSMVNNFVSGLILAFERPIQVGDTIEVGQLLGEVRHIGIRASTVRTYEGAEVIVPNGDLTSSQVTNWTLSDRRRRIQVPVGVAYGTDPEKVIDLLKKVAHEHPDVIGTPAPTVLFKGFGDSSLDFDLRFWTARFERWREVRSDVTVAVNAGLKDAGIEIPFPQRDLHVRSVAPSAARALGVEIEPRPQDEPSS